MFDYTADNLLASIRDIVYAGTSQRDWDDTRLLRLLNRQVHEYLEPFIIRARKGYFVTYTDQPLVANQAAYTIPSKASVDKMSALQLVDTTTGSPFSQLIEIPLEKAITFGASTLVGPLPQGLPQGYYFRGNQVVLVPVPSGSPALSLRIYYPSRPSTLVLKASCVAITNLTGGGGAVAGHFRVGIGATVPAGFITAASCDLVQNSPGFDVLFTGAISAISGGTYVDFVGTLPTGLAVGDWLCLADTAPVVTGAPAEVVLGCLINKTALEILTKKAGDHEFTRREKLLHKGEEQANALLKSRRNEGDHAKAGTGALHRFHRGAGGLPF